MHTLNVDQFTAINGGTDGESPVEIGFEIGTAIGRWCGEVTGEAIGIGFWILDKVNPLM